VLKILRKYLPQSIFVVLWHMSYADLIEIQFVLAMKWASLHAHFQQRSSRLQGCDLQNIEIRSGSRKTVHHGYDEASHAIKKGLIVGHAIEFV